MKLLIKLAVVAVVLLGLLGLAGWLLVPPAAKSAVERGSSFAFGVPTTLAKLDASLGFSTSSDLTGLRCKEASFPSIFRSVNELKSS